MDDKTLQESIRQERETFDQHKNQQAQWFTLRLIMGYFAIFMLLAILGISGYIVLNSTLFPASLVTSASVAFFGDVLLLIICVWRIVLNPSLLTRLAPVTVWHPSVESKLQQTAGLNGKTESDFRILSATYGAVGTTNDVTELIRSKIKDGCLDFQVTNYEMGGDPKPNIHKVLVITYIKDGKTITRTVSEMNILKLP